MRILAALVLAALAGCAEFPGLEFGQPSVDGIIAEAVTAARAPAAEQKSALARAQQAFTSDATAGNRLRLATLLAALPAPYRDDARAAELLEPIADATAPGIGRFAALLATQIAERQRLSRELRERDRSDKERDKREEALRQQLDALRAIERGILEREEKLRRKPR